MFMRHLSLLTRRSLSFRQISHASTIQDEVVVVTGGSGFLGQHIVHLLQTQENSVKEIRIFDIQPIERCLDYEEVKPVKEIIGDICDRGKLREALRGATAVIHLAALISFGTFPKLEEMNRINVMGTKNLIDICVEENVQRLINCSTVDVVIGYDDEILSGDENSTRTPERFLFPGYPETKLKAETLILKANGKYLANGEKLHTLSIRPSVMYGEGDPFMITGALQSASDTFGYLIRVGDGKALLQMTYVGNVAWGFLKANEKLRYNSLSVGGHFFFITDYTQSKNFFAFVKPYLDERGFRLSSFSIPYIFIHGTYIPRDFLLRIFSLYLGVKIHLNPLCSITYLNRTLVFSGEKARSLLGYSPLYTSEEAMERSKSFYNVLKLT